jgi:hypothetical protein
MQRKITIFYGLKNVTKMNIKHTKSVRFALDFNNNFTKAEIETICLVKNYLKIKKYHIFTAHSLKINIILNLN